MQQSHLKEAQVSSSGAPSPLIERLRDLVLSGDFPLREPLPETVLADRFNVSRTPIREAMKQLENEGLVEIRARVGTFVRLPTRREVVELFELKGGLEGLAVGLFTRRGNIPELDALRDNVQLSRVAADRQDAAAYAELVHVFHNTLVKGADNRKLADHYVRLMNQLAYHRLVIKAIDQPGRLRASVREHEAVLEAIEQKDQVGAEVLMRRHVDASSTATFRSFVMEEPEDSGGEA